MRGSLKQVIAAAGVSSCLFFGALNTYSQESVVSFKSAYKETLKKVEGVKDVYYQDKYAINASIDVSQLSGFLDNLTMSNAGNVSVSIVFDRSIFNQYWLKNTGTGQFENGDAVGDDGLNVFDPFIALADMDNDGYLDGIACDDLRDRTVWLKNDGTGKFSNSGNIITTSSNPILAVGDLNGDGWNDVFIINYTDDNENAVFLNDGQGGFVDSGQRLGTNVSSNLRLKDLNGDGALDAFVVNTGNNIVWLNNGQGVFTTNGQVLGNAISFNVELGDINNDNYIDAYVVNKGVNQVYLNDGKGIFTASVQTLGNTPTYGVGMGDFNGDGWLDLIDGIAHNEETCAVWLNTKSSDGIFKEGTALEVQGDAIGVYDFNKDGKQDLFVGGGPSSYLMIGSGNATFAQGQAYDDVETNANVIPVGDINNDTWLDLFVSNRVYTYEGNEIFTFDETLDYAEKGEDDEKFNLLKIKDGVSGVAKFVTSEDVASGDKPKYKKTLTVMFKWNAKKLNVIVKGTPILDSAENLLDLEEDLDELKATVSETNKKAVKKLTEADQKQTNFIVIFNGYVWDGEVIPYTGTESAKFSQYKEDDKIYTEKLGTWNVSGSKASLEYLGRTQE